MDNEPLSEEEEELERAIVYDPYYPDPYYPDPYNQLP